MTPKKVNHQTLNEYDVKLQFNLNTEKKQQFNRIFLENVRNRRKQYWTPAAFLKHKERKWKNKAEKGIVLK
jgi:hypothetical protein